MAVPKIRRVLTRRVGRKKYWQYRLTIPKEALIGARIDPGRGDMLVEVRAYGKKDKILVTVLPAPRRLRPKHNK